MHATDTLRVVSYNTLNYPGSTSSLRNPDFRRVLRRIQPDVVVVQEMTSQAGMNEFQAQVLNVIAPNTFRAVPFNDGPDTDNGFFYDSSRVAFLGAQYIATALRDIAGYTVRLKASGDTIRFYSLHLKASSGTTNEQARLAEAIILRDHLNTLTPNSLFLVLGDYNIYRSSEPAFERLLASLADNDGRCFDQLNLVGTWNNPAFAPYHTQSPRVRSFDGGSTGGMDDRFDIFLSSNSMQNHLLTSSITAFGNDGQHYNDSINAPPNLVVPDSIADALHNASDHLPVYGDLVFDTTPPPPPPIASTDSATVLTPSTAILYGTVNPNGSATQVRFIWGRGTSFSDTTAQQAVGSGSSPLPVNAPVAGLTPDTVHSFRVLATNAGGTTNGSVRMLTTLPLPPPPPLIAAPPVGATVPNAPVALRWTPVAGALTYRVEFAIDSLFSGLLFTDSLLTDTSLTVDSLSVGQTYFWRVNGTNAGGNGFFSSTGKFGVSSDVLAQIEVFSGWNLLSLPLAVADPMRATIYPTATSPAYAFSPAQGYREVDSLQNGSGFWLKFGADQLVPIIGETVAGDTIALEAGWNIIGVISEPLDTTAVTTIPAGILTSDFFGYDGGYLPAAAFQPGQAYWVKSSGEGVVVLQGAGMRNQRSKTRDQE